MYLERNKIDDALKHALIAKEINPSIKVIVGGVHPTMNGSKVLDYENIDFLCIAEGENTIVELLHALEKHYYPKSKKWALFVWKSTSFDNYEGVQVHIKDDGEKYIIGTIEGHLYYENNIKDCYKKRKQIIAEVSEIFKDAKKKSGKRKHSKDKSGKSIVYGTNYWFKSGDYAAIDCIDWSSTMKPRTDNLNISLEIVFNFVSSNTFLFFGVEPPPYLTLWTLSITPVFTSTNFSEVFTSFSVFDFCPSSFLTM